MVRTSGQLLTPHQLQTLLDQVPRARVLTLPTPLEEAKRLGQYLKAPRLFLKRDDLTGVALGGNKCRNLEFRLARPLGEGSNVVVAGLDVLSNAARQTAGMCNRLGLECVLVLVGKPPRHIQGNLLADYLLGAEVHFVRNNREQIEKMEEISQVLLRRGRMPHILNANPMFEMGSALAYAEVFLEIREQLLHYGEDNFCIYIASAGKGQAGLVLAQQALGVPAFVQGVTPTFEYDVPPRAARIANETAKLLGIDLEIKPEVFRNASEFVGRGYGQPTPECIHALRLFAKFEGILLDPVYTAKAAACMLDHIRTGALPADAPIVFIHTGGTPNLFTLAESLLKSYADL